MSKKKTSTAVVTSDLVRPLRINLEGKIVEVARDAYVKAKTKQMRQFGYTDLDEAHVNSQIDALLAGKKIGDGLTVIGKFMEGEVVA